jgi:hypothetical protein
MKLKGRRNLLDSLGRNVNQIFMDKFALRKPNIIQDNNWNLEASFLGIARIQYEIGIVEKPEVIISQELQKILAKSQSRKMWPKVSRVPLQNGQNQVSSSTEVTKRPILAREGKRSQAIFQRKCLSQAWSLRLHRECQASEERGEALPYQEKGTSCTDFTEKRPDKARPQHHLS